jgi:hypothetical protein
MININASRQPLLAGRRCVTSSTTMDVNNP